MKISNWTIKGKSTAGKHTTIIIEELKISFDIGVIIDGVDRVQAILLSHGHRDHIGSLHILLAMKHMRKLCPPLCIMPDVCIPPFKLLCSAASALDRGKADVILFNNLNKVMVVPADKLCSEENSPKVNNYFSLTHNPNYFVSSIPVLHKITSFGYCIYSKRVKLKPEYHGRSAHDLKLLRSSGISITHDTYIAEIAFTGDCLFTSIINNEAFTKAKLLIMECTFLDDFSMKEAQAGFHVHISEIKDNFMLFDNESIVLTHFSDRYSPNYIIEEVSKIDFPETFRNKLYLLLENGIHKIVPH